MKVSTQKPFQIVFSIYEHEYFGHLIESYVVQLDEKGRLSYTSQNVGAKNAKEFADGLDLVDYHLIDLTEQIHQDELFRRFNTKKLDPVKFFQKVFAKDGDKALKKSMDNYVEKRKGEILDLVREHKKQLFEMGSDGIVTWKTITIPEQPVSVRFNFFKNEDNTHYFPTLLHEGKKVEFRNQGAILINKKPAYMLLNNTAYWFNEFVDGLKFKPFLTKKFILVEPRIEDMYYSKFIAPLVARHEVFAKGFDIHEQSAEPKALLRYKTVETEQKQLTIGGGGEEKQGYGRVHFSLLFDYDGHQFENVAETPYTVDLEKKGEREFVFHRVKRDFRFEREMVQDLRKKDLKILDGRASLPEYEAANWIAEYQSELAEKGLTFVSADSLELQDHIQSKEKQKTYFKGRGQMKITIQESNDWFDIFPKVTFGEFEIPFIKIRSYIMKGERMIELPNGQMAALDPAWFEEYKELCSFADRQEDDHFTLKKHHVALVKSLGDKKLAQVSMKGKLQQLENFEEIEDYPMPKGFKGELRPYQKAGYNWMNFLNEYNFGGCLADDMGLGKTIQTLALLTKEKEAGKKASLLIMPTSLVYNWTLEARKFAPMIRILQYVGTNREKNPENFKHADLVLTSYGTARIDADILKQFQFNYIVLDESQIIKNPNSGTAKQLGKLKSLHKLILTGTPLENTTMDLWSQINFVNPGLLGSQSYFKKEFMIPIERGGNEAKVNKLHALIKPFVLRRHKSQVAKDLPEKVENLQFCKMTERQAMEYERARNLYRNQYLNEVEQFGANKSQITLLQGLSRLRQIANHPKMVDKEYDGDSGKMEDATEKLKRVLEEGHKVLIFSQFVKHLSLFRQHLNEEKIRYSYLDGGTKDRQTQVQNFQNDSSIRVFLLSLKAGGVGLNLTAADYVFMLDPWYNPAVERQAVDRTHRIGQTKNVFIYKFITRDSVEEKILKLQEQKQQLADNLISTEESFVKSLSQEDIMNILG